MTNAVINTGTMTLNDPGFGSLTNTGTINLNANLTVSGAYVQNTGNPTSTLTTSNNANLSTGSFSGTGGSVVLNGSSLFTITQTADGTYSGSVSGTGTVTKIGSATLTLAGGADSFAPSAITINAGAVKVVNASILDSALAVTTGSSGILSLLANQSIASLMNSGATNLVANLTTSGNVIDFGTLNVVGALAGTPVVETAATRTLTTAAFAGDGTVNLGGTTGSVANTLIINQSGDSVFTGSFTGGGGLTKTGAGDLNLQGANSFTGPLAINGGTLDTTNGGTFASTTNVTVGSAGTYIVGTDDTIKSITNNGVTTVNANLGLTTFTNNATGTATVNGSLTTSGAVSNAGSLTFSKNSTETLATTLDNSGTLTSQGTLGVTGLFTNETGATATLGSAGSNSFGSLTNNGTLTATTGVTVTGAIINSGSLSAPGFSGASLTNSGTITSSSLIDIAGAYVQNAGSLTATGGLATGSLSGNGGAIHLDNNSLYILNQTANGSFAGSISGTGTLDKYGNANLTLTGGVDSFAPAALNIFAGQVIVANADELDHALNVAISSGAALTLEANQTIHDLTGTGSLNLGTNNLTLANGGNFSGPITGTGGVQVSNGNFTLGNGSSVITSQLTISNATLNIDTSATANSTDVTGGGTLHLGNGIDIGLSGTQSGTLNSATVVINGGGSLTGNGTINGTILVGGSTPGTVAPGNSPGLLTVSNITFGNLATAAMQIDGTAGAGVSGGNDQIVVTGQLVLQPGSALAIIKSQPASGFQFALAQQVQLFKFAPGAVSGYFGSATLSSDFTRDVIFNIPTGAVIGLGNYTPATFTAAVANTRNETAILNAMLVNATGGVNQYYGGNLLPYLTSALASGTPGATDAAFNHWSPEGYAGIVDQMKLAVLDNLPNLSSYDTLTAGRSYAFGNMGTSGMSGVNRAGFTQSKFKDTAMNVGLAHQFSMVELSLSYGHSDGTYHSALMQGTVLGNQVFAGASAPLALGERLRVMALVSYSDFSAHGTRSTNSGTADFAGVKGKTTAYGFGLAYHQPGATRIDVSAQAIGMSESLNGFTEYGAASNAAGTLDLMHVGETHHQAWVAQLDARVTRDITRHLEGYVAAHYDGELGAKDTPITGNVAVESVNYTVINPGLARNRASGEAGVQLHITPSLDLDAHAKGGTDAAYNFGGGLRLSF